MFFIALLITLILVYFLQRVLFFSNIFEKITYDVKIDVDEMYEGDDFYFYEEITSHRALPVPYIKVDTSLPKGLRFRLTETVDGQVKERLMQNVQSVFVLHRHEKIRRRWRVNCNKRGEYSVGRALLVSNDIFGTRPVSLEVLVPKSKKNSLTVLPKGIDLAENFSSSRFHNGDILSNRRLLPDPFLRAGTREYTSGDPMRSINWKLSASHGRLMVNVEEFTRKKMFNIVLNMNSRGVEKDAKIPCDEDAIERCITVCASVFERVCPNDIGVRLISNTPSPFEEDAELPKKAEIDGDLFFSEKYEGRGDVLSALRMLSKLKVEMSCPVENMIDHIYNNYSYYAEDGGLLFVSAYFEQRMINFARLMADRGVQVVFYITTSSNSTAPVPDDVEVYFQTHF